jgi:hypothetical protein
MSKLTEYLKLIPAGIDNLPAVVEGIRNNVKLENGTLTQDEEDEIIRRRLICSTCPFMSLNAVAAGTYKTNRTDAHCTMCGCPIKTKTASLASDCGIATYNARNLDNQLQLKWEKYKPNEN